MQWTIPSLLYQTSRKNPLVYKGLNNENNLALCLLGSFACLLEPDDFFQNQQFQKNILGIPSVSNDLDPDQA